MDILIRAIPGQRDSILGGRPLLADAIPVGYQEFQASVNESNELCWIGGARPSGAG